MRIYWFKAQAPRRVLALVKHLGVKAECVEMDLMGGALATPDYVALNPNMKAPTLVDGDLVLWESSAIMAYLCIKRGSDMWPADNPVEQVEVLRWLSWNDCHWAPAVSPFYFEHIVKSTFGMGPPDRESLNRKFRIFTDLQRCSTRIWKEASKWPAADLPSPTFSLLRWPRIGERRRCRSMGSPISYGGSMALFAFPPGPIPGQPRSRPRRKTVTRCRWPDELRRQPYRHLPSSRHLHRPHSQGREAGRFADPAHQGRVDYQPSRQPRHLASRCRRRCSPAPTSRSSEKSICRAACGRCRH
jgi:glutathione S-transferase